MGSFQKQVRTLLLALTAITTILIALGSYVRTTGAGLSCPDWPLCFGTLLPDFSILGVPQEVIHRYIAKLVGLICIGFVVIAAKRRTEFPKTFRFALVLLGLVIVQGVFGGLTVTLKLNPMIVATHLALGSLFWQLSFFAAIDRPGKGTSGSEPLSRMSAIAAWLTYLQIVLGGYVAASGAALACMDFPLCGGALFPEFFTQGIQMLHRLLFAVLLVVVILLIRATKREGRKLGHLFGVVFMISLQLILGVGNIHMRISPWMSIAHLLIAELILFALLVFWKGLGSNRRVLDI